MRAIEFLEKKAAEATNEGNTTEATNEGNTTEATNGNKKGLLNKVKSKLQDWNPFKKDGLLYKAKNKIKNIKLFGGKNNEKTTNNKNVNTKNTKNTKNTEIKDDFFKMHKNKLLAGAGALGALGLGYGIYRSSQNSSTPYDEGNKNNQRYYQQGY